MTIASSYMKGTNFDTKGEDRGGHCQANLIRTVSLLPTFTKSKEVF